LYVCTTGHTYVRYKICMYERYKGKTERYQINNLSIIIAK